ncbi:hypothetical protein V1522DRAFT_399341 [Lipomyces starkeyi]
MYFKAHLAQLLPLPFLVCHGGGWNCFPCFGIFSLSVLCVNSRWYALTSLYVSTYVFAIARKSQFRTVCAWLEVWRSLLSAYLCRSCLCTFHPKITATGMASN